MNNESNLEKNLDLMTDNLKNLNTESADCCDMYLQESIKDQQRKILVIGKLCELIED